MSMLSCVFVFFTCLDDELIVSMSRSNIEGNPRRHRHDVYADFIVCWCFSRSSSSSSSGSSSGSGSSSYSSSSGSYSSSGSSGSSSPTIIRRPVQRKPIVISAIDLSMARKMPSQVPKLKLDARPKSSRNRITTAPDRISSIPKLNFGDREVFTGSKTDRPSLTPVPVNYTGIRDMDPIDFEKLIQNDSNRVKLVRRIEKKDREVMKYLSREDTMITLIQFLHGTFSMAFYICWF